MRWLTLGVLGLAFWWGIFATLSRLLRYFRGVADLGPILAGKLLGMMLVGFFSILLLSNVITALSSFFLARDLDLLNAAPVRWPALYAAKLLETLVNSSWMVALMAIPLLAAYGVVYSGGLLFPLIAVAVMVPFFMLPAAIGSAVTLLLVNAFPARRTRDILSVVAVITAAGLVLLFRLMRPERLARPEGFRSFTDYLAALDAPSKPWLPSDWAQQGLMGWLLERATVVPFVELWGATLLVMVTGALLHRHLYPRGFSKAQEGAGQAARTAGSVPFGRRIGYALLAPIGVLRRELVLKELRVFFRDTTQWSQLLLLAVLIIVYVFDIKFLPLTGEGVSFFLRNVVPFFNLLLAGFVMASIAARFIFPAVSLEGRTFWLLRSSPLPLRDLLWAKFWVGAAPLLILAVGIVWVTDTMLQVSDFMFAVTLMSITLLTFALSALALSFGTLFPQFETENAAQIPTSFGGLIYMMTAVALLGTVIVLEARPVYIYLGHHFYGTHTPRADLWDVVLGFGLATVVCLTATLVPISAALRRLTALERAG
jgi:ABC-2 type transport system permease protein